MALPTQWTWVWASSGSWWWTGKPGICSPWGHKELDTTEWLNWTEQDFPGGSHGKEPACQSKRYKRPRFNPFPGLGRFPQPTHPSTLVWRIPWAEETGRLQTMGLQRVGLDGSDSTHMCRVGRTITLSSNSVKQEETTHPANTSKCYKENCLFMEQRIRDKILWDTVTTSLPVMTYRTNRITQPAQDTLGCECHSKWEWTKVLCKNQCQCCLEGGHSSWTTKSSQ